MAASYAYPMRGKLGPIAVQLPLWRWRRPWSAQPGFSAEPSASASPGSKQRLIGLPALPHSRPDPAAALPERQRQGNRSARRTALRQSGRNTAHLHPLADRPAPWGQNRSGQTSPSPQRIHPPSRTPALSRSEHRAQFLYRAEPSEHESAANLIPLPAPGPGPTRNLAANPGPGPDRAIQAHGAPRPISPSVLSRLPTPHHDALHPQPASGRLHPAPR